MKRLLLLILIITVSSAVFTQSKYRQDFENGFGDMVLIDVDKKTPDPKVATFAGSWNIRQVDGNSWATSNSWFAPFGKADDWMITPIINDIVANTVLTWKAFSSDPTYKDSYEVRVSTGGDKPADFTKVLFTKNGENGEITERSVSLKDYAGQSIRIAFRNVSNDKFLLNIDDIDVVDAKQKDIAITKLTAKKYVLKNNEAAINFEFKNFGLDPVTELEIEYTDGITKITEKVTGINVKFYEVYKGQFNTKYKMEDATEEAIKVTVKTVNGSSDDDGTNNASTFAMHGLSAANPQKMLVEEGTGTWCGWCPRGTVNMEKMKEKYPEEFIGIAVHNFDPMAVMEYDQGITNLPNFNGFPSVVINRSAVEDPGDLESILLNQVRNDYSPAKVNIISYSLVDRTISIEAGIDFYTQYLNEDLRLIGVIVEDGVTGTDKEWDQVNYYAGNGQGPMGGFETLPDPVPAADMVYNQVGRELLYGFEGKQAFGTTVNPGDFADIIFDVIIDPAYDINNVSVVLMVADGDGTIIGVDNTQSKVTNIEEVQNFDGLSLSPNPTSDMAYLKLNIKEDSEVTINIINHLGQTIAKKNYGTLNGNQVFPINSSDFGKGIFFVNLNIGDDNITQKLIVR